MVSSILTLNKQTTQHKRITRRKPAGGTSKARAKCTKPGPITNNPFIIFLRSFRKKNCGLEPFEMFIRAARAWKALPESKKDRYRRMACKMTKSPRHKRRRICSKKC